MRILFFFITLTYLLPFDLIGQATVSVSGEIRDENGAPIPQVLIVLDGTTTGTYSDNKGRYSIKIPTGKQTFVVSAIGYNSQTTTLDIRGNRRLHFILEEQNVQLTNIEVYGKTKSQQLRESSFTINSLDVKQLASGLNELNSVIGRSSGIKIREDGGVGADFDLSINGLSGHSVRYFIDGVPLTSMGNGISLANLPVNIVERIEIYKGVVPTDLGADALGGAINIVTKKDITNYVDASYGIGSFNTHKADLNAQFTDKKTGIFIRPTLGINYSKNNYTMRDVEVWNSTTSAFELVDAKRFHDGYTSLLGQIQVGVNHKAWADLFSISASYSKVDNELQTGSVQSVVYGMAKRKNDSYHISSKYQKRDLFVKGLSTNLSISHTWDNMLVVDTAYRKYRWDGSYIESSRNEITGRGKSMRHTNRPLTIGRANFNYAINAQHALNLNYLVNHISNKRYDEVDTDFEPSKDAFSKHIIGLSYSQNFWQDKLANTVFLKEYISHLKIGQQDLSWITGSDEVNSSSTTNNWGYGLSSRFRFAEWLAVKASYEHSVRLPLAREYLGNGTTVYPNFTLKPENSNNVNLGLFGTIHLAPKHFLYYETGLFYRKVQDYIRLVITESEGMSQYDNVSNVSIKGVESEIRYDYDNLFQTIVNFSYLDEKNKTQYQANGKPEITYNNRMPNRPWLFSNVELNIRKKNLFGQRGNQLKLAYYFQYVHWFYLTWEGYGSLSTKATIPTQYVNNASLTYSLKNERYNISLECNNLFDRTVYDNYKMQKPGRSFFCKFRLFINNY